MLIFNNREDVILSFDNVSHLFIMEGLEEDTVTFNLCVYLKNGDVITLEHYGSESIARRRLELILSSYENNKRVCRL